MKLNNRVTIIIIVIVVAILFSSTVVFTIDLFGDNTPPQLPPNAIVRINESIKEFNMPNADAGNVTLQRFHSTSAEVDEVINITLLVTNNDSRDLFLRITEAKIFGVEYPDNIETRILKYENQRIRFYYWGIVAPKNATTEISYHVRSRYPRVIDFSLALANDQFGNQYESIPTSITVLCIPDGFCNDSESFLFCPEDCFTGELDGFCDAVEDGIDDPDCSSGTDPDYDPEADTDNDGVSNKNDLCPGYPDDDADGDGKPDSCDVCLFDDQDDSDNDGFCGNVDKCPNTSASEPKNPVIYGCSCSQILDIKPGENEGELKYGCSKGTVNTFTKKSSWARALWK